MCCPIPLREVGKEASTDLVMDPGCACSDMNGRVSVGSESKGVRDLFSVSRLYRF